jgi:putative ABC transport system ATP-binding protein
MNVNAQQQFEESCAGESTLCESSRGPDAIVELRGVSKSYNRGSSATRVVDGVDLEVRGGECVFLLGPSGSGKTTLLSIVGCVLRADDGLVRIFGQDVGRLKNEAAADLRRERIGFVFQRFHLIRGLTAAENVAVPLMLSGWKAAAAAQRAKELLEFVDITDRANEQPHRLSVGQCQRVAFARALATNPDLILADEPTASLDAKTGLRAIELLRSLTVDFGKAVIVVTHDSRILPFADRVLHMENGKLEEQTIDSKAEPPLTSEASLTAPLPWSPMSGLGFHNDAFSVG